MTPEALKSKFPAWNIPNGYSACYQPDGGILFPEKVVATTARLARQYGADLRADTEVIDVSVESDGRVQVRTSTGDIFQARRLILSPGAWLSTLIAKSQLGRQSPRIHRLTQLLKPERQVVNWYAVKSEEEKMFQPDTFPVWVATYKKNHYYGFPVIADSQYRGVKVGRYHHAYEQLDTEASLNDLRARQTIQSNDREYTDEFMATMFQPKWIQTDATTPLLYSSTCIFTNSPDEHFIVDPQPDPAYPQISLISACSGHGFKFSSVLGEIMARFILEGAEVVEKDLPIKWLDAGRLLGDRPPLQVLDPHIEMKNKQI